MTLTDRTNLFTGGATVPRQEPQLPGPRWGQIIQFTSQDSNMSCGFGKNSGTSYIDFLAITMQ